MFSDWIIPLWKLAVANVRYMYIYYNIFFYLNDFITFEFLKIEINFKYLEKHIVYTYI